MSAITFYGKPRCISNNKQKKLLRQAGLDLDEKDILTHHWEPNMLARFFGELPVEQWFNPNAPDIKSGELSPASFSKEAALQAMISNPLLIRRPLIRTDNHYHCGFDLNKICDEYGISSPTDQPEDIESCAHNSH